MFSIKWLDPSKGPIGVIRIGKTHEKYGDPYDFLTIIQVHKDKGIYDCGACGKFRLSYINKLKKYFISKGYKYICWERKNSNGGTRKRVRING